MSSHSFFINNACCCENSLPCCNTNLAYNGDSATLSYSGSSPEFTAAIAVSGTFGMFLSMGFNFSACYQLVAGSQLTINVSGSSPDCTGGLGSSAALSYPNGDPVTPSSEDPWVFDIPSDGCYCLGAFLNCHGLSSSVAGTVVITSNNTISCDPAPSASSEGRCTTVSGDYCDGISGCTAVPSCEGESTRTSQYYTSNEVDCPGCGPGVQNAEARALCTNLIIGRDYKVTIHFFSLGCGEMTVDIFFTATATSEYTSWTAFPTPDATCTSWLLGATDIILL